MEWLSNVTLKQVFGALAAIAAAITIFIEWDDKINSKPITKLFGFIGSKFNAETINKVSEMEKRMSKLEHTCTDISDTCKEQNAIACRIRILRFGDELRRGSNHSLESYNQIFEDIKNYENYCRVHPDFKNNKTVMTTNKIEEAYAEHMDHDNFL